MNWNFRPARPVGYQQFAAGAVNASTALTVPAGAVFAICIPSAQAVRFRDDTVLPTATIGYPLAVGQHFTLDGQLSAYRFIAQVAGAALDVTYYGGPSGVA